MPLMTVPGIIATTSTGASSRIISLYSECENCRLYAFVAPYTGRLESSRAKGQKQGHTCVVVSTTTH